MGCQCSKNDSINADVNTDPRFYKDDINSKNNVDLKDEKTFRTYNNASDINLNNEDKQTFNLENNDKNSNNDEDIIDKNDNNNNDDDEDDVTSYNKNYNMNTNNLLKDNDVIKMSSPKGMSYANSFITNKIQTIDSNFNSSNLTITPSNPDDSIKYNEEILKLINSFRLNPSSFIPKIKNLLNSIKNHNGKKILSIKGMPKVALIDGKAAINNLIEMLPKLEPMNVLEYNKLLEIEVPEKMEEWVKFGTLVEDKTKEINTSNELKISMFSFHFDIGIPDPELSFLTQLLDDNSFKGKRRNHFCDPKMKYIAITQRSIMNPVSDLGSDEKKKEKKFCAYFCFGKVDNL